MSTLPRAVDVSEPAGESCVSPGARRALYGAGIAFIALVACWCLTFHDVTVARADAHAYAAFYGLSVDHPQLAHLAQRVTGLIQPDPYVFLAAAPVILALVRRRWALALGLALMIPGAIATSELLKPLLDAPRPALGVANARLGSQGSWPSGHATAAMILAMACLLASPARWRPYVAVAGTLFALAVIYSVLSLGWHYPSDVLGGILVASTWTLVTVAAVLRIDARYGRNLSELTQAPAHWLGHLPSVGTMLAAAALPAAAVLALRGGRAVSFAGTHTAFLGALLTIAALAALVLGLLTRVDQR